jgi:ribosomal protein S18 acetylase RimI-like enzyme
MKAAEDHARANGATEIACETAEGATHLISLYERKGFRVIGRADFEDTNYQSVILVKKL